jgi:hypothetical protein
VTGNIFYREEKFMGWYDYIDTGTPAVFNPRVTPDPVVAEKLEEKLQQATRKFRPSRSQRPDAVPAFITLATLRTG